MLPIPGIRANRRNHTEENAAAKPLRAGQNENYVVLSEMMEATSGSAEVRHAVQLMQFSSWGLKAKAENLISQLTYLLKSGGLDESRHSSIKF
jgi:23S rRNA U2552 (ribose-2'-O)-methylase RlmE/FtsJ